VPNVLAQILHIKLASEQRIKPSPHFYSRRPRIAGSYCSCPFLKSISERPIRLLLPSNPVTPSLSRPRQRRSPALTILPSYIQNFLCQSLSYHTASVARLPTRRRQTKNCKHCSWIGLDSVSETVLVNENFDFLSQNSIDRFRVAARTIPHPSYS